jgi:DNA-binding NtrC family response regulator
MSISESASSRLSSLSPGAPLAPSVERDEHEIIGTSAAMRRLRLQVQRIGPHFRTVLISGEAGTGKGLVARALYSIGQDAGGPLVTCGATGLEDIPVECEASAGSADAISRLMNMSRRGTLFLDGIHEMSLAAQGRLLDLLRQHELAQGRLQAPLRMDLRTIASTREDLKILVSAGRFRQELYQRLATVEMTLPPLRERIEDLPELASHFLRRFALLYGKSVYEIADVTMERMRSYRWPCNVRELEDVLHKSVMKSEGWVLQPCDLPSFAENGGMQSTAGPGGSVRLQDVVEQHVLQVLKDCGGNKLRAAEVLGISRSTLYRMLGAGGPLATVD